MTESNNPYAAAASDAAPLPVAQGAVQSASQGLRFVNLIVDQIVLFVLQMVFGIALLVVLGEENTYLLEGLPGFAIALAIVVAYYIFFEGTSSRTVGKFLTGTIVVNEQGGPPTFGQIVGRSFARLIPFEAFTFLTATPRGLHDKLPKTYVVKVR